MNAVFPVCAHMLADLVIVIFFFFNDTATTEIYTLSLHDALPISCEAFCMITGADLQQDELEGNAPEEFVERPSDRSEEHTSELQSPCNLVCRLLLEKKKSIQEIPRIHTYALPNLCNQLRSTASCA